jgi:hypothetical protein
VRSLPPSEALFFCAKRGWVAKRGWSGPNVSKAEEMIKCRREQNIPIIFIKKGSQRQD